MKVKNIHFKKTYKTIYHTLLCMLLISFSSKLFAQKNLAPSATAAASTCNTGPCSSLNDLNYLTSCTQQMWISTATPPNGTEWFDFTWTTPQTIKSITIWHGNTGTRFLAGATVQIWNPATSAYVNAFNFSGLNNANCVNTVNFPITVTTLKLRFTAFQASGSQLSNMNFREIEIWQGATKPNDAGISFLTTPLCSPTIVATLTNFGVNTLDSAKINWSVNGSMQAQMRYNTKTNSGISNNVTLTPDFNFVDGDNYTVKAWTTAPNAKTDSIATNDTTTISFKYQGPAGTPGVTDNVKCGPGKAPLVAKPVNQGDSIYWFNAATGNNVIAKGKNTFSPPLVLGSNTFYAQAFKMSGPQKLGNGLSGTTYYRTAGFSGGMFDITPKNDLVVDSFTTRLVNFTTGQTFNIYYKTGTFVGSETNASAWTPLAIGVVGRVLSVGGKNLAYITIPELALSKGVVYGFYITTTNAITNYHYMTSSTGLTIADNEMTVFSSKMVYGTSLFATIGTNYVMDLEVNYRKQSCGSARVPMVVTVKPSPAGAAFIKGTPFQTTQPLTLGTKGNPDIVAKGDVLTYEITPPTGYINSGYGSTWIMSNLTFRTQSGRVLPTSYYTPSNPAPSGSNNAKITFTADANIVDSTIIMTLSLQDLGPHFCDSSLTRYIFIAPRPVADFKFLQPVCDGDNVIFNNLSTLSSGNIIHKWDFGTGNPADTATTGDVVFTFPTSGTYNVKLITTSAPYGYTDTKILPVVVTEIPKIGFKVFNACLGDSVSFVNSTTISKGSITYRWDFGNGRSSTRVNPKMKYTTAGSYKVTLTATSNGCSQSITKNAWEFSRPVAKFNTPTTLCDKTEILFTNTSTISMGNMGYRWDFSDGGTSTATNPLHSFATAGAHSVKMKVISEFGCADSITKNISLSESPLANFTTGPVCNLSNTNFIFTGSKPGGSVITSFNWDFGVDGTTTVENPSKLLSVVGKKLVTLTLTSNNGCKDVVLKEVNVKLQSKASFDVTDVCDGENAVFTNSSTVSSGSLNYVWKFGDGKNSNAQSPRHLYPSGSSQTYNVTLVAIVQGGCSDSITKAVSVNSTPSSAFTYTTSGRLVNLKATQPGNTTYHWNVSDGGTATQANTQYHFLNYPSGNYTICLSVYNAAGCFSQSCQEVAITGGINNLSKQTGIDIYPNPNKGTFTINVQEPKKDIAISIYNVLGEHVKTLSTNSLTSQYSVDLDVANGVYLIQVTNGGMKSNHKVNINK
jgi:PKD repeat protein